MPHLLPRAPSAVISALCASVRAGGWVRRNRTPRRTEQFVAAPIARQLAEAERDGCHSHGLHRLPQFVAACRRGKVRSEAYNSDDTCETVLVFNRALSDARAPYHTAACCAARQKVALKAEPIVENGLRPGVVRVDAGGNFLAPSFAAAVPALVGKAAACGVAAAAVVNWRAVGGALWQNAEALASRGLACIVCCNTPPYVAPHGGGGARLLGTNPISFAYPGARLAAGGSSGSATHEVAFVWDMATSACARGELEVLRRAGAPLPEGMAVDADGKPTADPTAGLAGAQLPFGGHKGSALSVMVELLAGAMLGTDLAIDSSEGDHLDDMVRGMAVIAIDPGACEVRHVAKLRNRC